MRRISFALTTEQVLAQTLTVVQQLGNTTTARLKQHDLELDDQDDRTERLEKILLAQEAQLAELKESRADIKSMLEILLNRSLGNNP